MTYRNDKTVILRVAAISETYGNDKGLQSLMAIPRATPYQTSGVVAPHRRALRYATAGANPNAFAYGLGTDLFASIRAWVFDAVPCICGTAHTDVDQPSMPGIP